MTDLPIAFRWDGEVMRPIGGYAREADRRFTVGERYRMEIVEERSVASHRHFFASVREAWSNLPDSLALEFPTPEHLRKRALIETGFYEQRSFSCATPEEARRLAGWLKPSDPYAIYAVSGTVVVERTAKSQSAREMGKKTFQESKEAALAWCDELLGLEPGTTAAHVRSAAA